MSDKTKITIFGLAGTGKSTVGKMLAEKLGYEYQSSGGMFRKMAEEEGLSLQEFEKHAETDSKYDIELDRRVEEYGNTHTNFIFESRLAWHFIPDSFKICLTCDLDESIRRVASRESKNFDIAKKETITRANIIKERYKKYYNLEYPEESFFDLVIDTTKISPPEIVQMIMRSLGK